MNEYNDPITEEQSNEFGKTLDSIKHIGVFVNGELVCHPDCSHPKHEKEKKE
jgi:hypothetical protein